MAFRPEDTALLLRDGEDARLLPDGPNFKCNFEIPDEVDFFGGQTKVGMVTGRPSILYATADPGRELVHDDELTVDGVKYAVHHSRKRGDGVFSIAELRTDEEG
jgi:hypothetical protein